MSLPPPTPPYGTTGDAAASLATRVAAIEALLTAGISVIADGSIVNADVNAAAAIAYSKLNLAASIQRTDLFANTATSYTTGWGGAGAGSPVLLGAGTISLTTYGGLVLVLFACTIRSTVVDTLMGVVVQVDGATNLIGVGNTQSTPADRGQCSVVVATVALAAGAHTFRPYITFNAGTNTVDNNGTLVLVELLAV